MGHCQPYVIKIFKISEVLGHFRSKGCELFSFIRKEHDVFDTI